MIPFEKAKSSRIANIIEDGRWAGPQKRITLVSSALKKHRVETIVLLPNQESDQFRQELDSVSVVWKALPLHRLGRGWKTLALYLITFIPDVWSIFRELRRGQFDAVHVSGGVWQIKGVLAGRLAAVPVIWHLNDTMKAASLVVLFSLLGRLANGFFVAANRVKVCYLDGTSLSKVPFRLIPAPVNTIAYCAQSVLSDETISALPFPRIVTVGNVGPLKGLETLIDAAALLLGKRTEFSVVVAGPIYSSQVWYHEQLLTRIRQGCLNEKFHFVGAQENIPSVLKCADVYVCSSTAEASPMAVWEAMSMACAIVSTDVGDVAEYIRHGESGLIVPVGDAQAMADAITLLASDAELRLRLGHRAREIACRELDIEIIAGKTAAGYAAIIAST